jgi:F0F1-type ATP synthase assembly protein I
LFIKKFHFMTDKQAKNDAAWWQPALLIFGRLSAWIAAPLLLAFFVGQWLDKRYGTEPWFFLGLSVLAFTVSMIGLVRVAAEEYAKIDAHGRSHQDQDQKASDKDQTSKK